MVIWTMIRMLAGRWRRIRLMAAFDRATTTVTAAAMTRAGASLAVTASAEQTPRIWRMMGLLSRIGSSRTRLLSAFIRHPPVV